MAKLQSESSIQHQMSNTSQAADLIQSLMGSEKFHPSTSSQRISECITITGTDIANELTVNGNKFWYRQSDADAMKKWQEEAEKRWLDNLVNPVHPTITQSPVPVAPVIIGGTGGALDGYSNHMLIDRGLQTLTGTAVNYNPLTPKESFEQFIADFSNDEDNQKRLIQTQIEFKKELDPKSLNFIQNQISDILDLPENE